METSKIMKTKSVSEKARQLGADVRAIREELHLSQDQFGALFELTGQQISKYEHGESAIRLELYRDMLERHRVAISGTQRSRAKEAGQSLDLCPDANAAEGH